MKTNQSILILDITNLSFLTSEKTLHEEFSKHGKVLSCRIYTDKDGLSKGFGVVEYSSIEEAQRATDEVNGQEIDNRRITVTIRQSSIPEIEKPAPVVDEKPKPKKSEPVHRESNQRRESPHRRNDDRSYRDDRAHRNREPIHSSYKSYRDDDPYRREHRRH